jgi:hypothetical protein
LLTRDIGRDVSGFYQLIKILDTSIFGHQGELLEVH